MERTLAGAGLRVVCRHPVRLTPADTRVLWTEYTDDGHVLTRAFLDRYLCDGPSEVVHVRGRDAFEAARRVKRAVRSRHALGPFANVVHAAEQPGELDRQGDHLGGRCAGCARRPVAVSSPSVVRPSGHDFRRTVDVPALVERLWPLDFAAPAPHRLDSGVEFGLFMGADRGHTLDSTVTALWRALPGIEPGDAVKLTLWAGRTGDYPVAVGGGDAVEKSRQVLVDHGFRACGTGPYISSDADPRSVR